MASDMTKQQLKLSVYMPGPRLPLEGLNQYLKEFKYCEIKSYSHNLLSCYMGKKVDVQILLSKYEKPVMLKLLLL